MVEELVQWIPCRGGAISPLVTRGLFARHQVSVVFPRHSAIAWWRRKVLDRFQYRFWTCYLALTLFSTALSGYILWITTQQLLTPARLSALHCVVGRLALCLCLYFTETSCCAAVGTQAV